MHICGVGLLEKWQGWDRKSSWGDLRCARGPGWRAYPPLFRPIKKRLSGQNRQEVCPFTRKFSRASEEPAYKASSWTDGPSLVELMGLSEDEFSSMFSGSPVKRAKRRGLLRNVAVALGNWGSPEAAPVLSSALDDPEPLVRGHAAWALGEILSRVGIPGDGGFEVAEALLFRLNVEEDPCVVGEIEAALRG